MSEMKTSKAKGVLIVTPFFPPNMGGVETYADALTEGLSKLGYTVYVHTYSPITTRNVKWKKYEEYKKNVYVYRYPWVGKDLFSRFERFPVLQFMYLTPVLLIRTLPWVMFNRSKFNVIHCFGLNSALIGVLFKKTFKKRLVVTIHAVYERGAGSLFAKATAFVLNKVDKSLSLSDASVKELESYGVSNEVLARFRHWIYLDLFKPLNKAEIRREMKIQNKFTVIFVGRLLKKKGVRVLCKVAKQLRKINFIFIGAGPEEKYLKKASTNIKNINFVGMVPNKELYKYYNCADIFCIPSQYEEGFGIVIMEAVACGLPVVGAKKGGIPEALDESVSILVPPTAEKIKEVIHKLHKDNSLYEKLASKCRDYALRNFSEENINLITKWYKQ